MFGAAGRGARISVRPAISDYEIKADRVITHIQHSFVRLGLFKHLEELCICSQCSAIVALHVLCSRIRRRQCACVTMQTPNTDILLPALGVCPALHLALLAGCFTLG